MTEYPRGNKTLRRREAWHKWQNIIGFFVIVLLLAAFFSGALKSAQTSLKTHKSSWDSISPFTVVLGTQPISTFIYNPSTKKITLVKLSGESYVEVANGQKPLEKISELSSYGGEKLAKVISVSARSPVENYAILKNKEQANEENLEKFFVGFASLITPFKILFDRTGIADTNIAHIDLLRLWWQVKSLGTQNLELVDAAGLEEKVVLANGDKVMGIDDVSLNDLFAKYTENQKVLEEGLDVEIVNASQDVESGHLAESFIVASGARVVDITLVQDASLKTIVEAESASYTASYLAKILDCDINSSASLDSGKIRVVLGQDFAQKY